MGSSARLRSASAPDALAWYIAEIARHPLIAPDAEVALARRIRAGDRDAPDALVRANLRFVVSVAKKYQRQGVLLADLISGGNLGLIRAAHKFDETKGVKFISYAVWWIRQAILQALADQGPIVRLPLNRAGALHRIGRRASALQQELGREATHAEIAEGLDLTADDVTKTVGIARGHLSLDAPLADGDDTRLLDYLADEASAAPDEQVIARALTDAVAESLASLKPREATILRLYFGLDGGEPLTLEVISVRFGVTRERVRQIKAKALERLRAAARAQSLESFLG